MTSAATELGCDQLSSSCSLPSPLASAQPPLSTFQHLCAVDLADLPPFAHFRHTAIICTIGPGTAANPDTLAGLLAGGMSVARLNFSHGTYADHAALVRAVRIAQRAHEQRIGRPHTLALVADLKGPEIRIGAFRGAAGAAHVQLRVGQPFHLTIVPEAAAAGTADQVFVDFERIVQVVQRGQHIYIDEGRIALRVTEAPAGGTTVCCRVQCGGTLGSYKLLHLPDVPPAALPSARDEQQRRRDRDDIRFAVEQRMDAVMVAGVGAAADLAPVRAVLAAAGEPARHVLVLVKCERRESLAELAGLVAVADGLVVMRSTLELEMDAAQVCLAQKLVLAQCRRAGKIGVVGTQMLPSMFDERAAGGWAEETRRPASGVDVRELANAVLDGADVLMLAGSTAIGPRPLECVQAVHRACLAAEATRFPAAILGDLEPLWRVDGRRAILMAAVRLAQRQRAPVMVVVTAEGGLAELVATLRPGCPVVAVVREQRWARRLAMWAGVRPVVWTAGEWTASGGSGDRAKGALGVRVAVDEGWAHEAGGDVAVVVSELQQGPQCAVRVVTIGGEELQPERPIDED